MADLQEVAEIALQYVNTTHRHVFLTGKAGTGKTTFLKNIVKNTYKNAVVAAPTGIAAINAGGVTLHSLLQLPFGTFIPDNLHFNESHSQINTPASIAKSSRINTSKRKLIRELELLIIDEVSMLRADLLDCIDHTLRRLRRRRDEPFGGLQILFIGDLLQLPPVVKDDEKSILNQYYSSPYFFNAKALEEEPPILVELQKIYRQSDEDFIQLLNRFRHNSHTSDDISSLNRNYQAYLDDEASEGYVYLTTHNYKADTINQNRLKRIESESFSYNASLEGDFPENLYPIEPALTLKVGAQVMFIKNDPSGEGKFFNGKIGQISNLSEDEIWVRLDDGENILVETYKWENKRYSLNKESEEIEEKFLGSFEQYPIKLAWAVTIHKSQGLTFDRAILDLSGTFAPGQIYVALSRLTSMDGLILSSPIPENPPEIDHSLQKFSNSFRGINDLNESLELERKKYIYHLTRDIFSFQKVIVELNYHLRSFDKSENRSTKQKYLSWTRELLNKTLPLKNVGEKFIGQVGKILSQDNYFETLTERMAKAHTYFDVELDKIGQEIDDHRKNVRQQKAVKKYLGEIDDVRGLFLSQRKAILKVLMLSEHNKSNKLLTRSNLLNSNQYSRLRLENIEVPKQPKIPTAQISYEQFCDGKSVEEIANDRGLVPGTIEGHLASYVEKGLIDVNKLVEKEKIDHISKVYEMGFESLNDIKSKLSDEVSYGEIKMVLAHIKYLKNEAVSE